MSNDKVIGVLGGMGPDATVDFMQKVIRLTPASRDQDHVRMLIDHHPKVPSRQNVSPEDDERIRESLAAMCLRLEAGGADFLVMVCNTAHGWLDRALARISIPFISIIDETVRVTAERCPGARKVGVLATPACLEASLYQAALQAAGLEAVVHDGDARIAIMGLIDRVKAGDQGDGVSAAMLAAANELVARGAEAIIAGCTEIPLVLRQAQLDVPLVSSTDELARRAVALATGTSSLHPS